MTMFISINNANPESSNRLEDYQVHINDPKLDEYGKISRRVVMDTVEVQADGAELYRIISTISGIRIALNVSVMQWFGDEAKFIVANVRLK